MLKHSLAAKVTAIILSVLTAIGVAGSVLACILMADIGVYTSSPKAIIHQESVNQMEHWCYSALGIYLDSGSDNAQYHLSYKNFYFSIADAQGNLLCSTLPEHYSPETDSRYTITGHANVTQVKEYPDVPGYHLVNIQFDYDSVYLQDLGTEANPRTVMQDDGKPVTFAQEKEPPEPEDEGSETVVQEIEPPEPLTEFHPTETTEQYTITGYVPQDMPYIDNLYLLNYWLYTGYSCRYILPIIGLACLLGNIILYIYLLCAAGHHPGKTEAVANVFDRIPLDLYTLCIGVAVLLYFEPFYSVREGDILCGIYIGLGILVGYLLLLHYTMSFATRVKVGTVFRRTIIWMLLSWIWKILRRIGYALLTVLTNLSLLGGTFLILAVCLIWNIISIMFIFDGFGFGIFLWFVGWIFVVIGTIYLTFCLHRLKKGGESIAAGDLSYQISLAGLFGAMRSHAKTLNHISDGMSRAVEERLKSERFRTELITNVSHDLKTPLTSIVNYIDLLKKENIDNSAALEYIEVLDRQSARLKKLTEDLVEASKASTGNLEVVPVACELGEFLAQCAGEYREKLEMNQLELIVTRPEWPISIYADGRHLWRIFDNLLNNICKYAQGGTRVYLNLESMNKKAVIIFRNTSRYALNVTGEELMERFVRGDSSRHTEGSGLGLSIARSLTELQQGNMDIHVDGDLFKVVLTFNIMGDSSAPLPEQYYGNITFD